MTLKAVLFLILKLYNYFFLNLGIITTRFPLKSLYLNTSHSNLICKDPEYIFYYIFTTAWNLGEEYIIILNSNYMF